MQDRASILLSLLAVTAAVLGCSPTVTPTATTNTPRTIQLDDASLFTNGRDWIYTYPTDTGDCHVIGHDVEFVNRAPTELVVKLDSNTEIYVPISNKNFLVDPSGFHDVELELTDIAIDVDVIKAVVEASDK